QAQHPRQPHQLLQVQRQHLHRHPHQPQPKQHQQHQHPHRHRHLQVQHPHQHQRQHPHQPQVKQHQQHPHQHQAQVQHLKVTTTTTSVALPSQCFSYTSITDATRLMTYGVATSQCDYYYFLSTPVWVRFSGAGGTMLANYYTSIYRCNTDAPGWYTGSLPAVGSTVTGTVCYYWASNSCNWSNSVSVTNCNGYYVYDLIRPTVCNLRYCTM
ncbi:unnamed protein product, partial [Adineta steineri]